jgi:hypothetical protein
MNEIERKTLEADFEILYCDGMKDINREWNTKISTDEIRLMFLQWITIRTIEKTSIALNRKIANKKTIKEIKEKLDLIENQYSSVDKDELNG